MGAVTEARWKPMRTILGLLIALLAARASWAGITDNCPAGFAGTDRKPVKTRSTSAGSSYTKVNGGSPITAKKWFDLTCAWDDEFPAGLSSADKATYKNKTFPAIENQKITLTGYLLSIKKDPNDNDFHVEIGDKPSWNSRHLIAELPSTSASCAARKLLVDLVDKDIAKYGTSYSGNKHAFHKAVKIQVQGYVFLDMHHAKNNGVLCTDDGGRGLRLSNSPSHVVGLYEIHPAFSVKVLP